MRPPGTPQRSARIHAIDATRGAAMLAVFLSHFAGVYFRQNRMPLEPVYTVTRIASPAFMLVSGTLLGFFWVTRRDRFLDVILSYFGRGVFLLTIGRFLILLSHIPFAGGLRGALHWGFITDAIGVSLMVGPLIVSRTSRPARAGLATVLFALSWIAVLGWSPTSRIAMAAQETLFGPHPPYSVRWYTIVFPLVPWLSLFLMGSCFGELLARAPAEGAGSRVRLGALWTVGSLLLGAGVWTASVALDGDSALGKALHEARWLDPSQKMPPSPAFFTVYGAAGLGLLSSLLWSERRGMLQSLRSALELLGRCSLLMFVLQYFLYYTILCEARIPYTPFWPALFLASVAILYLMARLWDRKGWNRHLTLRLPRAVAGVLAWAAGRAP